MGPTGTERDENTMKKMSERQADELEKVRVMERERREDQSRRFADEKMDLIRLHDNNMNHFKTREEEERIEYKKKLMVDNQQQKEIEMEQFKSKMVRRCSRVCSICCSCLVVVKVVVKVVVVAAAAAAAVAVAVRC